MPNPVSTSKQCDSGASDTLYVVLHGLICLVEIANGDFIAYLNEMGDEHRYLCGDFVGEHEMMPSTGYTQYLQLRGVNSGGASLPLNINTVVKLRALPYPNASEVRGVISLPRPNCIHHYILGELDKSALQGDLSALAGIPTHISGVRVFEYAVTNGQFENVTLNSGPNSLIWQCPTPVPVGGKKIAVLHIYNEPPKEMLPQQAADHNLAEFNRTLAYLGARMTLTVPGKVPQPSSDDPLPPAGLLGEEVSALDHRQKYAIQLMSWLREFLSLSAELDTSARKKSGIPESIVISDALRTTLLGLSTLLAERRGGGGGTQVCGGANGILL